MFSILIPTFNNLEYFKVCINSIERTCCRNLFNDNQMIFYKGFDDLSEKLNKYKKNSRTRKRIAKNRRDHYFKHVNLSS